MNIEELFDKRINEIMNKLNIDKLKLLLEMEIAYEKDTSSCINDLKDTISKSSRKPLFITIQNHDMVELFIYDSKVKTVSVSGRKTRKLEEVIKLLEGRCKLIVYYNVKLPTSKYVDEYVFGIDFMDKNHLDMFKLMDELIIAIIDGRFKDIKRLVEKLYIHTRDIHFKQEEDIMKSTKYNEYCSDDYRSHIEWHKDFLDALKELKNSAERERFVELIENLLIIFETYFEKYLKDTDAKLANYLKLVLPKMTSVMSDLYG